MLSSPNEDHCPCPFCQSVRFFAATTAFMFDAYKMVGFSYFYWPSAGANQSSGGLQHMDEVERDRDVTINVGFGNITFCKGDQGTHAKAIVDVFVKEADADGTIEMVVNVPASPETDTIVTIVERCRRKVLTHLQVATTHFEGTSAQAFLFAKER